MNSMTRASHAFKLAAFSASCAMAASGVAHAQSAGQYFIKFGVNHVAPQVKSGDLSAPSIPNTKIDVKAASAAILTGTYMVTDQFAVEGFAGLPYEHEVVGDGAIAGVGTLGTIKQVSPTLLAQYRFSPAASKLRPYVGLGLTYGYFYGEEGSGTLTQLTNPGGPPTRLSAESAFGITAQLGTHFQLDDKWAVDAGVLKTFIKNKNTLSTGQTIETKLDPISVNLSVGRWF